MIQVSDNIIYRNTLILEGKKLAEGKLSKLMDAEEWLDLYALIEDELTGPQAESLAELESRIRERHAARLARKESSDSRSLV